MSPFVVFIGMKVRRVYGGDYEREGPKVGVFENEEARGVALEEH